MVFNAIRLTLKQELCLISPYIEHDAYQCFAMNTQVCVCDICW